MTNLEQLIEAGNPNGNTLAEIYANIRDKALEEAAKVADERANFSLGFMEQVHGHWQAHCATKIANAIRALKRNPNG